MQVNRTLEFKKNLILKRILFIIMSLSVFYIIFNFSSQDGVESGSFSRKITESIVDMLSKIKTMDFNTKFYYIEKLHPVIRKLAHFGLYTVVGFSVMGFMCTFKIRNIIKFITSFLIGLIYAISDEIHQFFIPGRGPSIKDVCIDSIGILTGIFLLIILIIFLESIIDWFKK